jgi:hypothetical protein
MASCAKQGRSPRERPELVGRQIKEVGMKQSDDFVIEEQHGQTTLFRLSQ